jgi:NAD-dependent deacetylase
VNTTSADPITQDIVNAENICVLTGAGISAESGIATFRGKDGLWKHFRPDELANFQAFQADPDLVWKWYQFRREMVAEARPNPGHVALARWEALATNFTLVTQTVDGLHQQAGSQRVLELHGNIRINRCLTCGVESTMDEITYDGTVPRCGCGGMLRPGVVWFGESLPEAELAAAVDAAQQCDLFITVGTSAMVYPAASLPELARANGAVIIEVNPEKTVFTPLVTHHIRGPAGTILPDLLQAYETAHSPAPSTTQAT